ncbi:MAG: NAD(P)-binding domain-containing protein [Mariprofundaceae bacterium]
MLIWIAYIRKHRKQERLSLTTRDDAIKAGLTEPASLHPVINPTLCIGCGSCVDACPEQHNQVLGLIRNKAQLVNPTHCIGHGACKTACPENAITLVFGTEKRGVDIPNVKPNFETNAPGIFIAGELGGMGLIRNAVEQGRQAIETIAKYCNTKHGHPLDVLIVGAGPAGFSASLGAMQHKLKCVTVEQETLGGTVARFPRGKLVMTAPVNMPMVGKVKFNETTKEELMDFWLDVEKKTGVKINCQELMIDINKISNGFEVKTSRQTYQTRSILLALGRRGTPRKLGVPGEDHPKVVYHLIDPAQYQGKHVLVVGGGDSALEAATSIADEPDTTVAISYRSEAFSRAKEKNRQKVQQAEQEGRLRVLMKSNVKEIMPERVRIDLEGEIVELENNGIIVCAGGILPTPFLKKIGIEVETKHGSE